MLHTHDRFGHREDRIDFHPAYHQLMGIAIAAGLNAAPWADSRPGSHVVRAAEFIVWTSVEPGHLCPMSMTYAVVPTLAAAPGLLAEWLPRLASREYDPAFAPASRKRGATAGMALTEKQGGSDVRANTTVAVPDGEGAYLLTGHKWFVSGTMADVFVALAQAPGGPHLLPPAPLEAGRVEEQLLDPAVEGQDGRPGERHQRGRVRRRLGAARRRGGAGVRTIIEMVDRTRLDCSLGSAGLMRHGLTQAIHHARHRAAFGKALDDQGIMLRVLADLALESEAATSAALRLAGAYDRVARGAEPSGYARIATPVTKYWICKRNAGHSAEALECLGGSGYVEDSGMPRLFRQSPLNGVWEGSGNVICLDVLRAMRREPESPGGLPRGARARRRGRPPLRLRPEGPEAGCDRGDRDRRPPPGGAHGGAAAGVAAVAPLAGLRLGRLRRRPPGDPGVAYGALPGGVDAAAIVARAMPE